MGELGAGGSRWQYLQAYQGDSVGVYGIGEMSRTLQVYRWTAGDFLRQAGILQGSRRGDSVRPTRQGPCAGRHSKQSLPLFPTTPKTGSTILHSDSGVWANGKHRQLQL